MGGWGGVAHSRPQCGLFIKLPTCITWHESGLIAATTRRLRKPLPLRLLPPLPRPRPPPPLLPPPPPPPPPLTTTPNIAAAASTTDTAPGRSTRTTNVSLSAAVAKHYLPLSTLELRSRLRRVQVLGLLKLSSFTRGPGRGVEPPSEDAWEDGLGLC